MVLPAIEPEIKTFSDLSCKTGIYDPWFILFEFFSHYKLQEIRDSLWEVYKSAIKDDSTYEFSKQKSDLVFLYERLNDLATASYVIARKKWTDSPEYHVFDEDDRSAEIFRQRVREFETEQEKLKNKS
jgi:hypothetical protein